MNIRLTRELELLVRLEVESGRFRDPSEVVSAALRSHFRQKRSSEAHHVQLRAALEEGIGQADRGELTDGPRAVARIRRSLRRGRDSTRGPRRAS